jgi:peptidoglycan hydrolase-like protein with peptidoglycan-binding domain
MHKKAHWIISVVSAGGLLLMGTALAVGYEVGSAPTPVAAAASLPFIDLNNCPTLAIGYHGGCVNELQLELNTGDNDSLPVVGTFGWFTRKAVIKFQRSVGLTPDGIVGPQTKGALDVANSVDTPQPGASLDPGGVDDAGKSVSECISEEVGGGVLEQFAKAQAAAKGIKLIEPSPWLSGAEMAGCILRGI